MNKYELDLKDSFINYITQTQRKYFKLALDYAIKHNINDVRVNRTYYYFDFDNLKVKIAVGRKDVGITYKLKVKEEIIWTEDNYTHIFKK